MNWKTLAVMALSIASRVQAGQIPLPQECVFTVVQKAPPPQLIGSNELTSRTQVLNEPESPVAIVRVDVSGTAREMNQQGLVAIGGTYRVEIQNVSDRILDEVSVGVFRRLKAKAGWSGGSRPTKSSLAPGESLVHEISGRTESAEAVNDEARIQTLVLIESASFDSCPYRPKLPWYAFQLRVLP